MVELIAGGFILYGTPVGVWSPSHPGPYPQIPQPTEIVLPAIPPVGYVEPPFNPGPYTYEDGTPIVL